MVKIENAVVVSCKQKEWDIEGKKGVYFETEVKIDDEVFPLTSKIDVSEFQYKLVTLVCELRKKTPKKGQPYTGLRITDVQ